MDLEVLITSGIGIITTLTGSWAGWFFARKKYNSEVDSNLILNMQHSLTFYKELSDDNRERLHDILEENDKLKEQIEEVLKENKQLKKDLSELKSTLLRLTTSICTDLSCQIRKHEDLSTLDLGPNLKKDSRK